MISFNQTVSNLLSQPTVEAFYLVSIEMPTTYRSTTFMRNIVMDDGNIYVSDGKLVNVDPPKLSATVDKSQYKISFADPDMYFGAYLTTGLVGKKVTVRVGFVDTSTGLPLPQIANTVLIYKGRIDSGAYSISTETLGSSVFVINCSSPMGDLDLVKRLDTTKDALRAVDPSDTSFEQIYEGVGQIELRWGKG